MNMYDEDIKAIAAVVLDLGDGLDVLAVGRNVHAYMDDLMQYWGQSLGLRRLPDKMAIYTPANNIVRFVSAQSNPESCRAFRGVVHIMPSVSRYEHSYPRWLEIQKIHERFRDARTNP